MALEVVGSGEGDDSHKLSDGCNGVSQCQWHQQSANSSSAGTSNTSKFSTETMKGQI